MQREGNSAQIFLYLLLKFLTSVLKGMLRLGHLGKRLKMKHWVVVPPFMTYD